LCYNIFIKKSFYKKIIKLNSLYQPLVNQSKCCQQLFEHKNKITKFVWANNHYQKFKNNYVCEIYPIPVIEIQNIGDIGFNFDNCFFEGYFKKDKLLKFNFEQFKNLKNFSLYGEKDFLTDIYNSTMPFDCIKNNIQNSLEEKIAINFEFKFQNLNKIVNFLVLYF